MLAPVIWLALTGIEIYKGWQRGVLFLITALLMLVAGLNIIPGSERIQVLPPYTDSTGNLIYASINSGKAVIAIALLAFMLRLRQTIQLAELPYLFAAIAIPVLSGLLLYGYSYKASLTIFIAILINLLIVCISEEGFFRWILQRGLAEVLGRWRWVSVPVIALVFTLLHVGWSADPAAKFLLGLAALCYAMLWYLRSNFWLCVFAHWGVNLLHMLILPYPLPG
ncbi:CPBP family intramembrane glutamic endopeptidase [Microbulbifer epialgicus]|uniref:Lysostaphin resistance A-like protein n=1 Tax=Microbulbifer epialgicus TaxID=393907 RepID=A0ABV4NUI4_9GAMM